MGLRNALREHLLIRSLISWIHAWRHRGYVGPRYTGLRGKARLAWQGFAGHVEIVSFAEPAWWERPSPPNPAVRLVMPATAEAALVYAPSMEAAYLRSFEDQWSDAYRDGQRVALALIEDKLAGFIWIQAGGTNAGCHFTRLKPGEYRVFRAGVLPEFRGNKVHTTHYALLVEQLFKQGARRVYVEAFEDNEFAWHAQHKAGFREYGRIDVRRRGGGVYVRWL